MDGLTSVITAALSFAITALLGFVVIPFLHKLKYGQTILDIGPSWHKNKQGTPTMGGIMFIAGITIASITGYLILRSQGGEGVVLFEKVQNVRFFGALLMAWGFGFIGFVDDVNHPYAVAVVVEQGGTGGATAAPLAAKALKKAIELDIR